MRVVATLVHPRASLAAQVAAQSRPIITLPPSSVPISLSELDQRFRSLVVAQRRICAEMAYTAFRLWQADEWEQLGVHDAEEYCRSLGFGIGHWRNLVTLGERLQSLTLAEISGFTYAAMQWMVKVHPAIWSEYPWAEEAKSLPTRDFALLVATRNEQVTKSLVEPRATIPIRVPLSQHAVIERRLETIRKQERLSSTADALAYALESVDRADLMADTLAEIQDQVSELKRIQDSLKETPDELESRLEGNGDPVAARLRANKLTSQILKTIGDVVEVHAEEVQSASTGTDG